MKNYAYVTLLTTNEFINGVVVLYDSWAKTNSQYPFYCVVSDNISKKNMDIMKFLGINLIVKEKINMPKEMIQYNLQHLKGCANWYQTFTKFYVFGLEQFDKIIYLDCDTYLVKNIDEMFDYHHMSGVIDCCGLHEEGESDYLVPGDNYFKYFNSGVLVIEPSIDLFKDIMKFIDSIVVDQILADQVILSKYFYTWKDELHLHLPVYYNTCVPILHHYLNRPWFNIDDVKIFHFAAAKPWQKDKGSLNNLEQQYMEMLFKCVEELGKKGHRSVNLISRNKR